MVVIALVIIAAGRLRHVAGGHRLPADRGPRLSAGRRAASGRRFARPHPGHDERRRSDRPPDPRASTRSSPSPASPRSTTMPPSPMPASPTSSSRTGAARGRSEDLAALYPAVSRALSAVEDGRVLVLPPPPIQGIGNAGGFTMQIELRDGSFDLAKLQGSVNAVIAAAETQSGLQRVSTSFRANVPQYQVTVDREKVEALGLTTDAVFQSLASYMGSSYVNQFNKFGRVFQVYVQGDSQFRLTPDAIQSLTVRNANGGMIPIGTVLTVTPSVGPSLISLYNLYPTASIVGVPAADFSSGEAMALMEQIANHTLPRGTGFELDGALLPGAAGRQPDLLGASRLAMLLVYLVLAGQYESWLAPVAVLLAIAAVAGRPGLGDDRAARRQQPLRPDRPGAARRAFGQERDPDRRGGARTARRGPADHGRRARGGPRPLPADPDDVLRLHPRRAAAGVRDRRRRQRAQVDRHHRRSAACSPRPAWRCCSCPPSSSSSSASRSGLAAASSRWRWPPAPDSETRNKMPSTVVAADADRHSLFAMCHGIGEQVAEQLSGSPVIAAHVVALAALRQPALMCLKPSR